MSNFLLRHYVFKQIHWWKISHLHAKIKTIYILGRIVKSRLHYFLSIVVFYYPDHKRIDRGQMMTTKALTYSKWLFWIAGNQNKSACVLYLCKQVFLGSHLMFLLHSIDMGWLLPRKDCRFVCTHCSRLSQFCDPEIFQLAARRRRKVSRGVWKIPELETKSRLDGPLQLPPSWLVLPFTSHFFFFYVNQSWLDRAGQADFGRVRWSNSHCVCWFWI